MGIPVHELKNIVTAYESAIGRLTYAQAKLEQLNNRSLTNDDLLRVTIPGSSYSYDGMISAEVVRTMLALETKHLNDLIDGYKAMFDHHGIEYDDQ